IRQTRPSWTSGRFARPVRTACSHGLFARPVRTAFKYKLKPTPEPVAALGGVVRRCRELYKAARHERQEAWEKGRVRVTLAGQSAQLVESKEVRPDERALLSQGVQDVLPRRDRAFQAFFRRVRAGEQPGYPRFQGENDNRYHAFTHKQFGNGANPDNGFLVL